MSNDSAPPAWPSSLLPAAGLVTGSGLGILLAVTSGSSGAGLAAGLVVGAALGLIGGAAATYARARHRDHRR